MSHGLLSGKSSCPLRGIEFRPVFKKVCALGALAARRVNNMKEAFKRVVLVLYFSIMIYLQADVWICYVGDFSPWSSSSVERCSFCMELM